MISLKKIYFLFGILFLMGSGCSNLQAMHRSPVCSDFHVIPDLGGVFPDKSELAAESPLFLAVYEGEVEFVKQFFTEYGQVDVNQVIQSGVCQGLTALRLAVAMWQERFGQVSDNISYITHKKKRYKAIAQLLVDYGATYSASLAETLIRPMGVNLSRREHSVPLREETPQPSVSRAASLPPIVQRAGSLPPLSKPVRKLSPVTAEEIKQAEDAMKVREFLMKIGVK